MIKMCGKRLFLLSILSYMVMLPVSWSFRAENFLILLYGAFALLVYVRLVRLSGTLYLHELCFISFCIVSALSATLRGVSEGVKASVIFVMCFFPVLVLLRLSNFITLSWVVRINLILLSLSFFLCLDVLVQLVRGVDLLGRELMSGYKATGPFPTTYTDTLGVLIFFYGMALFNIKSLPYRINFRRDSVCFMVAGAFLVVTAFSRSAILLLVSTPILVAIALGQFRVFFKVGLLFTLCSLLAGFLVFAFLPDIYQIISSKFRIVWILLMGSGEIVEVNSTTHRLLIWSDALTIWLKDPLAIFIGFGFSSLPSINEMTIKSIYLVGVPDVQSAILDLVFSSGLLGFSLMIVGLFFFYKRLRVLGINGFHLANLMFWFVSPLSVQHKFESSWYFSQVTFSLGVSIILCCIYREIKRLERGG